MTKETKKFFDNNRLNRGFGKKNKSFKDENKANDNKSYPGILPPIEVMEQYEEISPGISAKLIEMAEREQNHRQNLEIIALNQRAKEALLPIIGAIFIVCVLCWALFEMISADGIIEVIISFILALSIFFFVRNLSIFKRKPSEKYHPQNHNKYNKRLM